MNEHPRLHSLHMSGVETNAQRVSYTVALLRGEIRRFVYAGRGNREPGRLFLRSTALKPGISCFATRNDGEDRMSLSFLKCVLRHVMAVALVGALPASMWAQDAQSSNAQTPAQSSQSSLPSTPAPHRRFEMTNYSKPKGYFPNPIGPYTPREIAPPDLTNSPKIGQLMRDGKIYLSMDDAVVLALENNLDIAIQRYNLGIADTDVLRAKSGANQFLGVNSGLVQNTPGGGVGGLSGTVGSGPGGTSAGTGGIGAGSLGLTSTEGLGPTITSFDPIVSGTLQFDHARFIPTSPFAGTAQNTTTGNFSYQQGFQWGTNMSVGF